MTKSETSPTQKMLNVWAIILIIWSLYRATFKTGLPILFDEFIDTFQILQMLLHGFQKKIFTWMLFLG